MVKILLCPFTLLVSLYYKRTGCAYQFPVANAIRWEANSSARTQKTLFASAAKDPAPKALFESAAKDAATKAQQREPSGDTWMAASDRFLASSFNAKSYYLLWSPGAWKKLIAGTFTLFLAHGLRARFLADCVLRMTWLKVYHPLHFLTSNLGLPLLASSCCLIQLGMNALSLGCGGFNTILGPVRPYFMSALVFLTFLGWSRMPLLEWAGWTALRWSMALLPEGIDLWNSITEQRRNLSLPINGVIATVQLDIPSMGCVSCIKSVDHALRTLPGVQSATSSLKHGGGGGQARIRITANSETDVKSIVDKLTTSVASVGFFGSSVESLHVEQSSNEKSKF